jgi:hypothetical protein
LLSGREEVTFVEGTTQSVETLFDLLNCKELRGLDKKKKTRNAMEGS